MAKRRSRKGKLTRGSLESSGKSFDKYISIDIEAFKPQEGTNKIRIVPGMGDDADNFGFNVMFHYGVGPQNETYICPLKSGEYDWCPVCQESNRLQNEASDEYLRKLWPKPRRLTYVVDRKDDDDDIKIWAMPVGSKSRPGVALQLPKYAEDPDTGALLSFDDYWEGHDLSFETTNAGKPTASYTILGFNSKPTPIYDDDEAVEGLMDWLDENPLDSIIEVYDPEYIASKFAAAPPEESEEESEEEEETPRRRKKTKKKAAKKAEPEESEDDEPPFDVDEGEEEEAESEEESEEEAEDQKAASRARLSKYKKKSKKKKKTGRK